MILKPVRMLLPPPPPCRERKNRDAFRVLLQRHRDEGTINVHTRWKEYQPLVEDSEEYLAVKKNASGSRPRELFEDLILVGVAI